MGATIQSRRSRLTGATIQVIDNRDGSFEAIEGSETPENMRWVTFCDTHGNYCLHATRELAVSHAADPTGWCGSCQHAYYDPGVLQ